MQVALCIRAHQGPIVSQTPQRLEESKTNWNKCLIACLLDEREFHPWRHLLILRNAWCLKGLVAILGKDGSLYVLFFENQ